MTEVMNDILATYGHELDEDSRAKMARYLETLTSAGKRDDLATYGLAYLEQLKNPDPRYTGC